jgi:hypothetical protein
MVQGSGEHHGIHIREIKDLAQRFDPQVIESCIQQAIDTGKPQDCELDAATEEAVDILSKASYVRSRMDDGLSLGEAVRELGRKIRQVQQGDSPEV